MTTSTKFFIAIPAHPEGVGIFGIGQTASAAIANAYQSSACQPPVIDHDGDFWTVSNLAGDVERFEDETDAAERFGNLGFRAVECTERLYRHVESHGADQHFGWTRNAAGLDDLREDEAAA